MRFVTDEKSKEEYKKFLEDIEKNLKNKLRKFY